MMAKKGNTQKGVTELLHPPSVGHGYGLPAGIQAGVLWVGVRRPAPLDNLAIFDTPKSPK